MPAKSRNPKKVLIYTMILMVLLVGLGALLWFGVEKSRERVRLTVCKQNIFYLASVATFYHEAEGRLPPAYVTDPNGKPLYSWRVLLMPYCDRQEFFKRYNLKAAWDDEANLKLAQDEGFANLFGCPTHPEFGNPQNVPSDAHRFPFTNYVAVVGPSTAFPDTGEAVSFEDITDGLQNTILFVEIANSDIYWSEPRDLRWDEMSFRINDPDKPSISSHHQIGPGVVFADGRFRRLSNSISPDIVKALLTINGGENISRYDLDAEGLLE